MLVRMLIGAYKDQVLDIVAHAAQNLLTTGQAALPDAASSTPVAEPDEPAGEKEEAVVEKHPGKKKK